MSDKLNDTLGVDRTPPVPFSFSEPFWEATKEKKIKLQYCRATGRYQFYPRPVSIYTGSRDLEWREVSGNGEVFSYTVVSRARDPKFRGHEPFAVVMVTLDEGVNVMGNLVHADVGEIAIGMRVRPFWAPLSNGAHLLMFEPDR